MDLDQVNVQELPFVGPSYAKKLEKLGISSVWDLLHHIPARFLDFSLNSSINKLQVGETATVKGTIISFRNQYTRTGKTMQILTVADQTGTIDATWFNQPFLARNFNEGQIISLAGKIDWVGRNLCLVAPEYEIPKLGQENIHTGKLIPIYPETAGISSKWLRRRIYEAWKKYKDDIFDFLPEEIIEKYNLPNLTLSLEKVHFPKTSEEHIYGKRRLAFNELLNLHLLNLKNKKRWQQMKAPSLLHNDITLSQFTNSLPFKLTNAQQKAVREILGDIHKKIPMNRLLEGDVGSGKTVVAAIAVYVAYLNHRKSLLMAPTQILANQHYQTLNNLFKNKVRVGLWTGTQKTSEDYDILVGTHALLFGKINLSDIALIIIDEQHKFGVAQREKLIKGIHTLTMTATPIPRTVALTYFGDLDLSMLDELPSGRQKIVTWVVPEEKRRGAYQWINTQIESHHSQVFIVCPLIEDSDKESFKDVKNVTSEFQKLQKIFKNKKLGLLHGRLKTKEKDEVINKFQEGKLDILVTTPVVEVGVDIPNATIMMIETADRFGLASLHQLRGRVGRGIKKSYCLLMTASNSPKALTRLEALSSKHSGFELAEIDLALRGPGEIFGIRQSGIPELKIADWSDIELIKTTKTVAEMLLNKL